MILLFMACIDSIPILPDNYFPDRQDSDYDGDGYSEEEGDCDDENILRSPGLEEVCDGIDNDCDPEGLIDNDAIDAVRFYKDGDDDGFGVENDFVDSCEAVVAGYVKGADNGLFDCDDSDAAVFPGNATNDDAEGCFLDTDNDNYGDATTSPPYDIGTDCDDNDASTHPGSAVFEDSAACVTDADNDGYGDANAQPPFDVGTDCDDGNANANPSEVEICDEIDNNCDGTIDEDGAIGAPTWYADIDNDGFGNALYSIQRCATDAPDGYTNNGLDCDDYLDDVFPGADEDCDLIDNDCDGNVDEGVELTFYVDGDGDGYGNTSLTTLACSTPSGYADNDDDCDDSDATQNPAADESCYNYEDDDCDGSVDEDDAVNTTPWYFDEDGDSYGNAAVSTMACLAPPGHVDNDDDCDDTNPAVKPLAPEYCNGYDDNCDGLVDDPGSLDIQTYYVDADGDGYGNFFLALDSCPVQTPSGEQPPAGYSDRADDCNDNDGSISPSRDELCDTIDQNCDGDPQLGAIDPTTWYVDSDGDGFGNELISFVSCEAPFGFVETIGDCNDFESTTYPNAPEYCNGKLDDCHQDEDGAFSPRAVEVDDDGDGYVECSYDPSLWVDISNIPLGGDDCDDTRAAVFPMAPDVCDGRYNDCDDVLAYPGEIPTDESDTDGDGYVVCSFDPSLWDGDTSVFGGDDCDDSNEYLHPYAAELEPDAYLCTQDMDEDGYADCGQVQSCDSGLFLTPDVAIDFVLIPEGVDPHNTYELSRSFMMSATEITQDVFLEVMGFNPATWNLCGGDCPIENVSYSTAADFTNELSSIYGIPECYVCTGVANALHCETHPDYTAANNSSIYDCPGYRLPTTAEWTYACLGGTTHDYWTVNGGGSFTGGSVLNDGSDLYHYGNWGTQPEPVGSYLPNHYGLYDLHGNVWEMHHDSNSVNYVLSGIDPLFEGGIWLMRSGSSYFSYFYVGYDVHSKCTYKRYDADQNRTLKTNHYGFRIVKTQP